MTIKTLASFEVLAQPVAPGVPDVPYVQQGFFVQVSNLATTAATVSLDYAATPAFTAGVGAVKLFTNFIDGTGTVTMVPPSFFLEPTIGFGARTIPAGATWLFGVQYLLLPPPAPIINPATGGTPQDSVAARGLLQLDAAAGTNLLVLATVRQVFYNYSPSGALLDYAEGAYSVPLIGGPQQQF